ncbi:MAG: Ig-like domain-containing protein [Pseudobutyrivibrio sp.]|nr:Ig-like domain-containing protein [Pseudobutyrivibrio sp.]
MKKTRKVLNKLKVSAAILLVCAVLLPSFAFAKSSSSKDAAFVAGDEVALGFLDGLPISWTVLEYDDSTGKALVITSKALDSKAVKSYQQTITDYYTNSPTPAGYVTWEKNYWRGWCNQILYKNCFNDSERARIQKTTISKKSQQDSLMNFYHDTTNDTYYLQNGYKNSLNMQTYETQTATTDYIFFLSVDEYLNYASLIKNRTVGVWPLRTNAYDDPAQGLVVNDGTKLIERRYYYGACGIRPAMYVTLKEEDKEADSSDESTATSSSSISSKSSSTANATATSSKTSSNASTQATATSSSASNASAVIPKSSKSYANNGTSVGSINLPDESEFSMPRASVAQVALDLDYLNSSGRGYTVTYKSSDSSVFTVDSDGKVSASGTGSATLKVRMKKSNGKVYTMSCRINVS